MGASLLALAKSIYYRENREISKVCLQIIFVCGSETGFLAWVRKNTRGQMFVSKQDRVFNLILMICNIYLRNTRE